MTPAAIVTDIEGTTTPIAFVRDVLFPFARARLPEFLRQHGAEPEVAEAIAQVRALAPATEPLQALLGWMDQDAKVTPLKTLQGLIWRQGYADGALQGALYPDVAPALRAWAGQGIALSIYSSGSEEAQRLLFGHSVAGDLRPLFKHFFDTRMGGKRDAASYAAIARRIDAPPARILFLSDVEAELDAARDSGFCTCQLVRPTDETRAAPLHNPVHDFGVIPEICGWSSGY